MDALESLRMSWRNVRDHKLRSTLTTLGVVIGVAAVITFVPLGTSLQADIIQTVAGDNTDAMYVSASAQGEGTLPDLGDARQGENGVGEVGYLPVCPPPTLGEEEYRFRFYALRRPLDLPGGANQEQFEEELEGAVLASLRYVGYYARPDVVTGTARGR